MPLHADDLVRVGGPFYGFDHSVRRARHNSKVASRLENRLVMRAVHHGFVPAGHLREPRSRLDRYGMKRLRLARVAIPVVLNPRAQLARECPERACRRETRSGSGSRSRLPGSACVRQARARSRQNRCAHDQRRPRWSRDALQLRIAMARCLQDSPSVKSRRASTRFSQDAARKAREKSAREGHRPH